MLSFHPQITVTAWSHGYTAQEHTVCCEITLFQVGVPGHRCRTDPCPSRALDEAGTYLYSWETCGDAGLHGDESD